VTADATEKPTKHLCSQHAIQSNSVQYAQSPGGGGIWMTGGHVRQCLIAGNNATNGSAGMGGAIYMTNAASIVDNCTIAGNYATNSGGVGGVFMGGGYVTNGIVYYNTGLGGAVANLGGQATNYAYSCAPELTAGVNGNVSSAPNFVSANPPTYQLAEGSPCIDTGARLGWMVAGALDLAGNPRIMRIGPDMGCYEAFPAKGSILVLY
jgi:hypothetical protein